MFTSKSIAILPFVNMSADSEKEYFSDGLTEEIINALTRVEGLKVTARTSSFAFKNKNLDVRKIGEQLNVSTILEGSVRVAKDKVRISAQLINVVDGFHFWSETFDRYLEDIFQVQDEISLLIADKLREHVGHFEIRDRLIEAPKIPVTSYQNYLRGKFFIQKMNMLDVEKGISILQKVINVHPNFPLPYLEVHHGYIFLGATGVMSANEAFAKGKPYLAKAIELDSNLPECQYHLAGICYWQQWNLEASYQHLAKALEIRPGYAEIYQSLAEVFATERKFSAALNYIEKALQLDPFSASNHFRKGTIFYFQENFQAAITCFEKCLSIEPHFIFARIIWGASLLLMGRIKEGLHLYQTLPPSGVADLSKLGGSILAYALQEDQQKVEEGIAHLQASLQTEVMERALFFLILIHTTTGNYQKALELIEKGIKKHLPLMILLHVEPFMKPLFPNPNFQKLMQQIHGKEQLKELPIKKYKKSPLKETDTAQYLSRLQHCMLKEKPYLNPQLTLRQLAKMLQLHPNYLSQILNEKIGQNFSEYINNHRLETFKIKAQDPGNRHLTILALALESGFNSKTVFNTYFKKRMGMTPSEYWKTIL